MSDIPGFSPLKEWEYSALKADIAKRGVLVPIEIDANTNEIVDGHHRLRAVQELGLEDYPVRFREYASDEERKLTGIVLNTYRRQLTGVKRTMWLAIANQLRLDLGYDDPPVVPPIKEKKPSASDEPDALAARQREHRLRERMKPKHALAPNADPWIVADEILDCLEFVRVHLEAIGMKTPLERLDQAVEGVKRLAWGPTELEAS
jgi:hypothetical protein